MPFRPMPWRDEHYPTSSLIGWPPSTILMGRPRGVVYWVARLMPMVLVKVAIRSITPIGMVDDVDAVLVGGADDLAVLHAAAADHDRPASRPVIAARVLIDPRRAAELTHPDDRRGIEQPPVGQVGDQGRHALVELGEEPPRERVEVVGVGVPAVRGRPRRR